MTWEKIGNRCWRATGKLGAFTIEQSGKVFWGRYASHKGDRAFKMRPQTKLSEAKAFCENNYYWEIS